MSIGAEVSTYETVISSFGEILLIEVNLTAPSDVTSTRALGLQSWLCHPRRADSAQPTFIPSRLTSQALMRTWRAYIEGIAS